MSTPSEMLHGEVVNGWQVVEQIQTFQGGTGGHFSRGYKVAKDGKDAFLKAMDLHRVIGEPLQVIADTIQQYEFERKLLDKCSRLSGIVRLLAQGEHLPSKLKDMPNTQFNKVYFLIFELADGDVRRELNFDAQKSDSWKFYVLHQIAVALNQLHGIGISHQDVKPSNVLTFKETKKYKLTDLGRSHSLEFQAPTDNTIFPGDMNYAPPEYFYQYDPKEYQDKRIGSDAYLLGSMMAFFFVGLGALNLTRTFMEPEYWFNEWAGSFQDILPYLIDAHSKATLQIEKVFHGKKHQEEITNLYFQLCHPDPSVRGNPKTRSLFGKLVGLERYVSAFDKIAKSLAIEERILRNQRGGV